MKRSKTQQLMDLTLSGVLLYVTLKMVYPDAVNEFEGKIQGYVSDAKHRASVWRALAAIRSLPETSEHE